MEESQEQLLEEFLVKTSERSTGGISGRVHGEIPSNVAMRISAGIPADILVGFLRAKSECIPEKFLKEPLKLFLQQSPQESLREAHQVFLKTFLLQFS